MKILSPVLLAAALGAGCSMNDKSTILPMDYVRNDWNSIGMTEGAQQSAYSVNQHFVESGITFHEHVQRDMGLSPSSVWYPTYDMAEGKVPTGGCDYTAHPDPAKSEGKVEYKHEAKPITALAPAPKSGEGEIDYNLLQRSIKR